MRESFRCVVCGLEDKYPDDADIYGCPGCKTTLLPLDPLEDMDITLYRSEIEMLLRLSTRWYDRCQELGPNLHLSYAFKNHALPFDTAAALHPESLDPIEVFTNWGDLRTLCMWADRQAYEEALSDKDYELFQAMLRRLRQLRPAGARGGLTLAEDAAQVSGELVDCNGLPSALPDDIESDDFEFGVW